LLPHFRQLLYYSKKFSNVNTFLFFF